MEFIGGRMMINYNYEFLKGSDKMKKSIIEIPTTGIGDVSDGYHTFNELYSHRAVLFSVICNQNKDKAWKSKSHNDGTMYANMFIVGIDTPEGQATYHYDVNPYWDIFDVVVLDSAPVWDGHTPEVAIKRISSIGREIVTANEPIIGELISDTPLICKGQALEFIIYRGDSEVQAKTLRDSLVKLKLSNEPVALQGSEFKILISEVEYRSRPDYINHGLLCYVTVTGELV